MRAALSQPTPGASSRASPNARPFGASPPTSTGGTAIPSLRGNRPSPGSYTVNRPGSRTHALSSSIGQAPGPSGFSPYRASAASSEWNMFGATLTIHGVRELYADLVPPTPVPNRSISVLSSAEVVSHSFAGGRWKIELIKQPPGRLPSRPATTSDDDDATETRQPEPTDAVLSLYLTCHIIEVHPASDVEIPTQVFFAVREPREQGPARSSAAFIWRRFDDVVFSADREYYRCEFPSLGELLANPRVNATDSLVLSVQIQSQDSLPPQFDGISWVPASLLTGVERLLDDAATSDVRIFTYERQPALDADDAAPTSLTLRKRVLFAHSPLLRARSQYFEDALSGSWLESGVGRGHFTLRLDEEFSTVFALLRWLYTNEIEFGHDEDVHFASWDDVLEISPGRRASDLGWHWQTITGPAPASEASSSVPVTPPPVRTTSASRRHASDGAAETRAGAHSPTTALAFAPSPARPASKDSSSPKDADPHPHPAQTSEPVYRLSHRYQITDLAQRALSHIIARLSPRSACPLMLATSLWPDLHGAIKAYAIAHYAEMVREPSFRRGLEEVAAGRWEGAADVLHDLLISLVPDPSRV